MLFNNISQLPARILVLGFTCILLSSPIYASPMDLNCPEAKNELSQLLKTNPQAPKVQALMKRVGQCIDEAAKGKPIPIQDVELEVQELYFIKSNNTPNGRPLLVARGVSPYCSRFIGFTFRQTKNNHHDLNLYGKKLSCGPAIYDTVPYQREISTDLLEKGTHIIRYFPWGSSDGSYKELTITID